MSANLPSYEVRREERVAYDGRTLAEWVPDVVRPRES